VSPGNRIFVPARFPTKWSGTILFISRISIIDGGGAWLLTCCTILWWVGDRPTFFNDDDVIDDECGEFDVFRFVEEWWNMLKLPACCCGGGCWWCMLKRRASMPVVGSCLIHDEVGVRSDIRVTEPPPPPVQLCVVKKSENSLSIVFETSSCNN
jgi:hypothetical protein